MAKYQRLSLAGREDICRGLACGEARSAIARRLGRERSTVNWEIRRNALCLQVVSGSVWAGKRPEARARCVRHQQDRQPRLRRWVWAQLYRYWSPKQIAAGLKRAFPRGLSMRLSHEALYT